MDDFEPCGRPRIRGHQAPAVSGTGVTGVVPQYHVRDLEQPYAILYLADGKGEGGRGL